MLDLSVGFPKPCDELWVGMALHGCNRYCATCHKIIHDLSSLNIQGAETLLEDPDEICVSESVRGDGSVALKPDGWGTARETTAVASVTMALATAACQTVPDALPVRYNITGKFFSKDQYYSARLESDDGRNWPKHREPSTGRFIFDNLVPGEYTLTVKDQCGARFVLERITITHASVEVTETFSESGCIIVGAMAPAKRPQRA